MPSLINVSAPWPFPPLRLSEVNPMGTNHQSDLSSPPRLWFVVPCFNEQDALPSSSAKLAETLHGLINSHLCCSERSGVLFIDDGSIDATWSSLQQTVGRYPFVKALRLSRNCGHQTALLAGLLHVLPEADCCISVDADLQDDLTICASMLLHYMHGVDIVYGVRLERSVDSPAKRMWASLFYRVSPLLGLRGIQGHADYRLLSSRVLAAIADYPERTLYLRGLIPLIGFTSTTITYERHQRLYGSTKYPFRKSLSLAIDGIISLSAYPLRLITWFGLSISLVSFLAIVVIVVRHLIGGTVQGWTSIMVALIAATGVQMLALGVIGEYLARIYGEVKRRPRYHIQESLGSDR